MSNNLTILIPSSPIPSHPSTEILDETISNIRKYTDAKIILMCDGVHESLVHRTEDYESYRNGVFLKMMAGDYGNLTIRTFEHHRHQSEMLKQTLPEVKTELVMFWEHDCTIGGGYIPFNDICDIVKDENDVNYIRFHIFHEILEAHKYLMLSDRPTYIDDVPLIPTIQFSARPFICKTKWLKDILWTYFKEGERIMLEDGIIGIIQEKYKALGFDTFGLYIYAPEDNMLRSFTSDGRKGDPKIISDNIIVHSAK